MNWVFLLVSALLAQPVPAPDAVPQDAIPAILELFKTCRVVGLGEGAHGNEQGHRFRLSLIRDPRFPAIVNDIVVESGTARYQDVMDRFIRGEDVPRQELRRAWEDTTGPGSGWDRPMYEEFYRAVRDVNAKLPKEKHIRVFLGDPPIAWEFVRNRADGDRAQVLRAVLSHAAGQGMEHRVVRGSIRRRALPRADHDNAAAAGELLPG